MRKLSKCMGLLLLSFSLWHCDTAEPAASAAKSPIQVLGPKAGTRYLTTDTVKIITETDYSKVAGNLSAIFSPDSGKSWELILSAPHHDAVARDTFPFLAKDFGFGAGQSLLLQIREYGTGGRREDIGYVHFD